MNSKMKRAFLSIPVYFINLLETCHHKQKIKTNHVTL